MRYFSVTRFACQVRSTLRCEKHDLSRHSNALLARPFSTQSSNGNWKRNGTPELIIGTAIIAVVGVDYVLQEQQEVSRIDIMHSLKTAIRQDEAEQSRMDEGNDKNNGDQEIELFDCIVKRIPKYFDGSKSLMGVAVGDKVSVLEERVGPDKMYHLCRLEKKAVEVDKTVSSIGWFPISCLEKIL